MNDRFKFRAWNKSEKRFMQDINIFGAGEGNHVLEIEECEKDINGKVATYTMYNADEIVLQHCTGLKDKNGKLIYEGDIVEVQYIGDQIPLFKNEYSKQPGAERFEIVCHPEWLKFYAKNDNYSKTCENHSLDLERITVNTYNKVYEVIGNIYENKSLLGSEEE